MKKLHSLALMAMLTVFSVSFVSCGSDDEEPQIKVSSITLNTTKTTLGINETLSLVSTVSPLNATNNQLVWTSDDESVATVDNSGKVTAVAPGKATITCGAKDGSGVKSTCVVNVSPVVGTWIFDSTSSSTLNIYLVLNNDGTIYTYWVNTKNNAEIAGKGTYTYSDGNLTYTCKTTSGETTTQMNVSLTSDKKQLTINSTNGSTATSFNTLTRVLLPTNIAHLEELCSK